MAGLHGLCQIGCAGYMARLGKQRTHGRPRVTAVQELTHTPLQPSLDCSVCAQPWPCAPAKVELSEEFQGNMQGLTVYLGAYMDGFMNDAFSAHEWDRLDSLYNRFLGWVRSSPRAGGGR